jgi:hypothetical protein
MENAPPAADPQGSAGGADHRTRSAADPPPPDHRPRASDPQPGNERQAERIATGRGVAAPNVRSESPASAAGDTPPGTVADEARPGGNRTRGAAAVRPYAPAATATVTTTPGNARRRTATGANDGGDARHRYGRTAAALMTTRRWRCTTTDPAAAAADHAAGLRAPAPGRRGGVPAYEPPPNA